MLENQLSEEVYERLTALSERGELLAEEGEYDQALEKYREALTLLPEPINQWEAATWLFVTIGDTLFLQGKYKESRENLLAAMYCPGGQGNAFIHLRLGEIWYELGEKTHAADELARAFMAEGDEIFEEEDPKYLAFLKRHLLPELGKSW